MDSLKVKFQFNDLQLEAEKGSNLLQVLLENDVDIIHFCYHPELSCSGNCRTCVVKDLTSDTLIMACQESVDQNKKYENKSENVVKAAQWAYEFHLVDHPLDCPVCNQNGLCELQDFSLKFNRMEKLGQHVYTWENSASAVALTENLFFHEKRCIMCTLCVRFLDEITATHELGIVGKGDQAKIYPFKMLNGNNYSQNLVDLCPAGSFGRQDYKSKFLTSSLEEVQSTCIGCDTGCAITVFQNSIGTYRVKPCFDARVNRSWMCDYGRTTIDNVSGPKRIQNYVKNEKGKISFFPLEEMIPFSGVSKVHVILTCELLNEEVETSLELLKENKFNPLLFSWPIDPAKGDSFLMSKNKNPNYTGAEALFLQKGLVHTHLDFEQQLGLIQETDVILMAIPEIMHDQKYFEFILSKIRKSKLKIAMSVYDNPMFLDTFDFVLPTYSFLEKNGTSINKQTLERKYSAGYKYSQLAKSVPEYISIFRMGK